MVTQLSFTWQGYQHAGTEVYEDGSGNVKVCAPGIEDSTCSAQWRWKWWTYSFTDHMYYFSEAFSPDCQFFRDFEALENE